MPSDAAASTQPAITVQGLTKRYKNGVLANDAIDLDVPAGTVFGLLGPNGAGKTTLVRQLTGELLPTSGLIKVHGVDVIQQPLRVKSLMGVVPQQAQTFWNVNPHDHLRIFARLHGLSGDAASQSAERLLADLDLLPHRAKRANQLSGGLQRKLLVGMAMIAGPPVLVLDEPTTGLDPRSRREIWALISSARGHGATVLLTTHYMDEAEELCQQVAIMGEGRILARGTIAEVRARCRNQFKATYQENGDRRTIYGGTQQAVMDQLARVDLLEYAFSQTSLEDIYLELTGHETGVDASEAPEGTRA